MSDRRKRALTDYIDSLGEVLPKDYERYMPGNEKEWYCVFCDELHGSREVVLFNVNRDPKNLGLFCCEGCDLHIQVMLEANGGDFRNFKKSEKSFVENVKSERTKRRITLYNTQRGAFEQDVSQFYQHLKFKVNKDGVYLSKATQCYFCEELLSTYDEQNIRSTHSEIIEDPVTRSYDINGGKIRICPNCSFLIDNNIPRNIHIQICTECNTSYEISQDEFDIRNRDKTLGKHYCPKCVDTLLYKWKEKDKFLTNIENNIYSLNGFRFKQCICGTCFEEFEVDLMLKEELNERSHQRLKNLGTMVCNTCSIRLEGLSFYKVYVHPISKSIFIILFRDNVTFWKYTICQMNKTYSGQETTKNRNELLISTEISQDIAETVCIAVESANELIYGTQGSLWNTD